MTEAMQERARAYWSELLEPLEGATVMWAGADEDEDGFWPTLVLRRKDGTTVGVIVSRDEEGNGPGHVLVGEVPEGALTW